MAFSTLRESPSAMTRPPLLTALTSVQYLTAPLMKSLSPDTPSMRSTLPRAVVTGEGIGVLIDNAQLIAPLREAVMRNTTS